MVSGLRLFPSELGFRTFNFSRGFLAGGPEAFPSGAGEGVAFGIPDAGVGVRPCPFPGSIPFSVAVLYFLNLALEILEEKWKTETL